MQDINLIVAIGKDNEIGLNNDLLWHIREDLQYFKRTTKKHIIIMGRKTLLSLPNGPLKYRDNIVITKDKDFKCDGAYIVHSIEESLKVAQSLNDSGEKKIFVIGGASIYEQFMPLVDYLYITHVFENFKADKFFPKIDETWVLDSTQVNRENIEHKLPHLFAIYKKA